VAAALSLPRERKRARISKAYREGKWRGIDQSSSRTRTFRRVSTRRARRRPASGGSRRPASSQPHRFERLKPASKAILTSADVLTEEQEKEKRKLKLQRLKIAPRHMTSEHRAPFQSKEERRRTEMLGRNQRNPRMKV
jgi:hypothetical protein